MIDFISTNEEAIKEWQTLISAIIALIVALLTILVMWHLGRKDARRHAELLRRKGFAARAQMPDALSQLCRFSEQCMAFLNGKASNLPPRATEPITTLKSVIEYIGDEAAQRTFELVSFYQVYNARIHSYRRKQNDGGPEHAQQYYDTALLRYYIDRLYEYARNESETIPGDPTRKDMYSGLRPLLD